MEMLAKNKIAIIVLALIVGVGAWWGLSGNSAPTDLIVTEDFTAPSSESDRDIVTTLLQLRSVSLGGTIFTDSSFQSLQDFGTEIIPEPVGRPNPFAPLFFSPPAPPQP